MGFAEVVEKRLTRVKKLLSEDEAQLPEAEVDTSTNHFQDEINETELKIQTLSLRLKADEELNEQMKEAAAEKKNEIERLTAELQAEKEEEAKQKQTLANMECRKIRASAEISVKDAESQEKLATTLSAYFRLTGVSFNTAREGYAANPHTKKAKLFQIHQGVSTREAADTVWSAIGSTLT